MEIGLTIYLLLTGGDIFVNSLNESTQNCYRILSNNINEDYIIEYRKPYGKYENNLSVINDLNNNVKIKFDGGLLVYKINKNSDGKECFNS